jgi:hypothetical protein
MWNELAKAGCIFDRAIGVSFDALISSVVDLDFVVKFDSVLELYMIKYRFHTNRKHFPTIEQLPTELKRYFWDEAKKYTEEHERRIKAAKIIYLVDQLCAAPPDGGGTDDVRAAGVERLGMHGLAAK